MIFGPGTDVGADLGADIGAGAEEGGAIQSLFDTVPSPEQLDSSPSPIQCYRNIGNGSISVCETSVQGDCLMSLMYHSKFSLCTVLSPASLS